MPFPDTLTLLRTMARALPRSVALEEPGGEALDYARLLDRVEALATNLRDALGPAASRPRIGLVIPNGLTMSTALLSVTAIGCALPFNPAFTEAEYAAYFAETGLDALLTRRGTSPGAERAAQAIGLEIHDVDALLAAPASRGALAAPASDQVAMVLLTSGSTGRAKKVPLTHANVCTSARDVCRSMALGPDDRCLSMWELFHIGGLVDLLLAPLHSGGTVISAGGFRSQAFFERLASDRPTWFQAVPTALTDIALAARRGNLGVRGSSLRLIRSVAAPLSPSLMEEIEDLFAVPVLQTFGMTEASPLITSTELPPAIRKKGSVGRSCGSEVGVFADDWSRIEDGREGEIAVRGPNVFSGYEDDAAANAEAFRNGWFRTGDLGRIDDEGHLFLTGRMKELVNRGGEKVNLREVDDAILGHPAVAEAACFPTAHPTLGEDVAAAVVLRPQSSVTVEELRSFLSGRLAAFKIPRRVLFVPSLPRNAVGKIDRRDLADRVAAERAGDPPSAGEITATERRISEIWARELDLAEVGPDDDFVLVGGDSLAGLRVFLAVEQEFGIRLPETALAGLSTVRRLARHVLEDGIADPESADARFAPGDPMRRQIAAIIGMGGIPPVRPGSLLKVANADGGRPPLVWFFNSPATEMPPLSRSLSRDQPLYGGFSGGRLFGSGDEALKRIAEIYVLELLDLFPAGSFVIGGNCQGGRVGRLVAQLLENAGRKVEAMCLLEFSHPDLADFDGRLLLMFGRQSRYRGYRDIRWGEPGWQDPFRIKPVVSWVDGRHGEFFRAESVGSLVGTLMAFLDGAPRVAGTLDSAEGRAVMRLHRTPGLLPVYDTVHRLRTRMRFGKSARFHPISGEAV